LSGSQNHGTATYGVVFSSGNNVAQARGILSGAERGIFSSYHNVSNRYAHTGALLQSPYFGVFQSNSWGSPRTTQYNTFSMEMDDMLFNFIIIPVGADDELTEPVAAAVRRIAESGLPYQLTSTATVVEGEWNQVMPVLEACVNEMAEQYPRVYASITLDHHPGRTNRIREAVRNVQQALDQEVRTTP
jgi:uncharacterized protein YqgV (UPF0045/DUF77 family)